MTRLVTASLVVLVCGLGYAVKEGGKIRDDTNAGKRSLQRLAPQVMMSSRLTATVWDDTVESVMTISYEGDRPEFIGSMTAYSAQSIAGEIKKQDCTSMPVKGDESQVSELLRKHRFPRPGQCAKP